MSKSKEKQNVYLSEIVRLKRRRRNDVLKCVLALTLIVILLLVKQALVMNGHALGESIAFGAFEMISTIGLAILGGTASIDYTKSGNQISSLKHSGGITDEHIRNYVAGR